MTLITLIYKIYNSEKPTTFLTKLVTWDTDSNDLFVYIYKHQLGWFYTMISKMWPSNKIKVTGHQIIYSLKL